MSEHEDKALVQIHGNVVFIGEHQVEFPIKIREALQFKDRVLVLLAPKGKLTPDRNILCYDLHGKLIWEVEEFRPDLVNEGRIYSDIWIEKDERIIAYNTRGFDVEVDLATGKISNFEFAK